jgi:AcrR family transcriptional regulator
VRTVEGGVARQSSRTRRHESTRASDDMPSLIDIEAEFDRFAAAMIPVAPQEGDGRGRRTVRDGGRRGPLPSISAAAIYEYALELLDEEGARAVTVRRLAADLKISTRTLYKRIGSRDDMIRNAVALHYRRLTFEFEAADCWETTAENWCVALHRHLLAHPNLIELLGHAHMSPVEDSVNQLEEIAIQHGISQARATKCCRLLAKITIGDALVRVLALRQQAPGAAADADRAAADDDLRDTIWFVLAGTTDRRAWSTAP